MEAAAAAAAASSPPGPSFAVYRMLGNDMWPLQGKAVQVEHIRLTSG